MMKSTTEMTRVWDPIVRIGHWIIVIGFFTAYLVEDDFLTLHVWAGYTVGVVVAFRLLWGLIGPKHARFTDFVYSPRNVLTYLKGLVSGKSKRYIGHSPAGGAMIILLLTGLSGAVYTGLELYAIEENRGPLASLESGLEESSNYSFLVASARADADDRGEEHEEAEEFWEELHEFFANFTLFLVILHIGGVLLSSYAHGENLIKAMFTGMKRSS